MGTQLSVYLTIWGYKFTCLSLRNQTLPPHKGLALRYNTCLGVDACSGCSHLQWTQLSDKHIIYIYSIDPVTGGPAKGQSSSLDEMTEDEKEREAEKLEGLLRKLNKLVSLPSGM